MATYRSADGVRSCASARAPTRDADRFRFPIEDYLFARGDDYVQKYRAESFLALSESIDLHQMDADAGAHAGDADRGARGSAGAVRRHAGAVRASQRAAAAHRDQFHIRSRRLPEGRRRSDPHHQINPCGADGHEQANPRQRKASRRARCAPGSSPMRSTARWCRRSICRRISPSRSIGKPRKYDYTRSGNPTRDQLAGALADLEGGAGAVVTCTGLCGDHPDLATLPSRRAGHRALRLLRRHLPVARRAACAGQL